MTVLPDQPSGPSARPTGRDHPDPARGVPAGQGPGRPHPIAVRVTRQVGLLLASLPPVFRVVLIALDVVPVTLVLVVGAAVLLLVLDVAGWRFTLRLFDRERLITGSS